jgi:hypothetical protein
MSRVVEWWDGGEVDSGNRQRSAAVERLERREHELAGRREENRRIQLLGRRVVASTHPRRAQPSREVLMARLATGDVDLAARVARHLNHDVRRAAETP